MSTSETPERSWPDCGEVQCKQVHDFMDTLLETLGVDTDKNTLAIGKGIQIATSVNELKAELTAAKVEVERLGIGLELREAELKEARQSRDAWKKMAGEFLDVLEKVKNYGNGCGCCMTEEVKDCDEFKNSKVKYQKLLKEDA